MRSIALRPLDQELNLYFELKLKNHQISIAYKKFELQNSIAFHIKLISDCFLFKLIWLKKLNSLASFRYHNPLVGTSHN